MDALLTGFLNWLTNALLYFRPERMPAAGTGWTIGTSRRADGRSGRDPVVLNVDELSRHMYLLGGTGSGKSTLLDLLLRYLIQARVGLCVLDPHGDLVSRRVAAFLYEEVQRSVATDRPIDRRQIYLIEPHAEDAAVGLDILRPSGGPLAPHVEELVGILRHCWPDTAAAPRTENLIRHLLTTLSKTGLTLVEGPAFLTDSAFRSRVLRRLGDPDLRAFWFDRYERLSEAAQTTWREPSLTRFDALLADPRIRAMLGQREHVLNLRHLMDSGGWLLVNLSRGQLKGSADLLGSFLIRQFAAAAQARAAQPERQRRPFVLVVDEFQHFAGESFESVLSEARKFGLYIIMANQYTQQTGPRLLASILANVGTRFLFALSAPDAALLARQLSSGPEIQRTLVELSTGQALFSRRGKPDVLMQVLPVASPSVPEGRLEAFRASLRRQHGCPLHEVEAEIARRQSTLLSDVPPGEGSNRTRGDGGGRRPGAPQTPRHHTRAPGVSPSSVPEADDE
jgi:hypothetical protein